MGSGLFHPSPSPKAQKSTIEQLYGPECNPARLYSYQRRKNWAGGNRLNSDDSSSFPHVPLLHSASTIRVQTSRDLSISPSTLPPYLDSLNSPWLHVGDRALPACIIME